MSKTTVRRIPELLQRRCRVCQNAISKRARSCPHCGEPYRIHAVVEFLLWAALISFLLYLAIQHSASVAQ